MDSFERFKDFSAGDFASEISFIRWVKFGEEKANSFWNAFLEKYPYQSDNIEKARTIVAGMRVDYEEINEENARRVWNHINNRVGNSNQAKNETPLRRLRLLVAAASVALILTAGYFFFLNKSGKQVLTDATIENDIGPGGNKAVLTLSDGSQIVLDSVHKGAISKQGAVTIFKLTEGELSYQGEALKERKATYNTVSTPAGGQYQLILADGTKVWLNAKSSLRFPTAFQGKERKVELTGEGYFEVTRNEKMPFYVSVGLMKVKVLGTRFNVNAYEDDNSIKTTLVEGSVMVNSGAAGVVLKPGQQAKLSKDEKDLVKTDDVDVSSIIAWKNNEFLFNETELKEAMKQLSRWYDFEVVYESRFSPTYLYGSISRDKNLTEVLKIMEASGLKFRIEKDGLTPKLIVLK